MRTSFLIVATLMLGGCACRGGTCDAPDNWVYACEPVPVGAPGCGPATAIGAPGPPGGLVPEGCQVFAPRCHPFYPDSVQSCVCTARPGDGGGALDWVCPL